MNSTIEPEKRLTPSPMATTLARMLLLERVGKIVGQERLAEALGIKERSLRAKLGADRRVSDDDLASAIVALERRAGEIAGEIAKIGRILDDGR